MKKVLTVLLILLLSASTSFALKEKVSDSEKLKSQGDALMIAGSLSEALECYISALESAEKDQDDAMYLRLLGQIGNIYVNTQNYERGIKFYLEGYDRAEKLGDQTLQSKFATTLVAAYCLSGNVDEAKTFYKAQMRLTMENVSEQQYYLIYSRGRIAYAEKNYGMARYYYKEGLQFVQTHDLGPQEEFVMLMELSNIDLAENKGAAALNLHDKALAIAKKLKNFNMESAVYKSMSGAFAMENQPDSAAKYNKKYTAIKDSLFKKEQFYLTNNKLFEYENDVNQKKIARLLNRNNMLVIALIAFTVLLGIIVGMLIKLRRRNKELNDTYTTLLAKNEALSKTEQEARDLKVEAEPSETRKVSNLNEQEVKELYEKIQSVFNEPEHFMQLDFKVDTLSKLIGSNQNYVSAVINYVYGKNFRQVLNEIRMKEVCKRIQRGQYANVTLRTVAEECGYKSSASFVAAFKKETGMTPSVYSRMIRNQNNPTAATSAPAGSASSPQEPESSADDPSQAK